MYVTCRTVPEASRDVSLALLCGLLLGNGSCIEAAARATAARAAGGPCLLGIRIVMAMGRALSLLSGAGDYGGEGEGSWVLLKAV